MMDNDLEIVGDNIDRAITIEMLPKGIPRGIATKLYETTRRKYKRSLTLIAAEKLTKAVSADSKVVISTGAYDPVFMPKGETDGPPGAAGRAPPRTRPGSWRRRGARRALRF